MSFENSVHSDKYLSEKNYGTNLIYKSTGNINIANIFKITFFRADKVRVKFILNLTVL